jgi:hypothetical protein
MTNMFRLKEFLIAIAAAAAIIFGASAAATYARAETPAVVCEGANLDTFISMLEAPLTTGEMILLHGETLDTFAAGVVDVVGPKPAEIVTIIVENAFQHRSGDTFELAQFGADGCLIGSVGQWPGSLIRAGLAPLGFGFDS